MITNGKTYTIADLGHVFRAIENSRGQIILVDFMWAGPTLSDASELQDLDYVEFYLVSGPEDNLIRWEVSRGKNGKYPTNYTLADVVPCGFTIQQLDLAKWERCA